MEFSFKQLATRTLSLGATRTFYLRVIALYYLHCFVVTSFSRWICFAFHWRITRFASEYSTSSISCHQVVRALKLPLLSLTRFYDRARTKVLQKLLALRCLVRWGPLNPPTRWALGTTSLIILSRTRIIRIRFRLNLLLFYSSLEWGSRGDWWSHSRKEACIICIALFERHFQGEFASLFTDVLPGSPLNIRPRQYHAIK